jgi:hypothetical protein
VIRASLSVLPLLYTGVFLAAILALWLLYAWRRRQARRRGWRGLAQCRLCAEWLRHDGSAVQVRCPSCGALNETRQTFNDI